MAMAKRVETDRPALYTALNRATIGTAIFTTLVTLPVLAKSMMNSRPPTQPKPVLTTTLDDDIDQSKQWIEKGNQIIQDHQDMVQSLIQEPEQTPIQPATPDFAKIDYNNKMVKEIIDQRKVTKSDLQYIEQKCAENNIHAMAALSVNYHESRLKQSARNKRSGACGIFQLLPKYAPSYSTTCEKIRKMSFKDQFNLFIRYLKRTAIDRNADYTKPEDVALAVFYPKAIGSPDLVVADERNPKQRRRYNINSAGDSDEDGKLTAKEYSERAFVYGFLPGYEPKGPEFAATAECKDGIQYEHTIRPEESPWLVAHRFNNQKPFFLKKVTSKSIKNKEGKYKPILSHGRKVYVCAGFDDRKLNQL